ncbi:hypothetical protein J5N97_001486 [Dioscorea zingiberensis]|uniref:Uncharacterized protein n=1 Tax=Dioscorea zingiberensis TaxID=325984 RepID=A0A9D5BU14_9LILI|nr:hypothetical protein J5N97_001486 [Dioscorea zingiberensis]
MASAHEEGFGGGGSRRKPLGLIANAMKRKESFVQFFLMTGILMLSLRSLSQKYRIHDLTNDNSSLRQERDSLSLRMASIKDAPPPRGLPRPSLAFSPLISAASSPRMTAIRDV